MCYVKLSRKRPDFENQAVTEVLNLEHYIHPWISLKTKLVGSFKSGRFLSNLCRFWRTFLFYPNCPKLSRLSEIQCSRSKLMGWAFTHCKFLVFHNLVYTLAVAILYVHRRDQHVLTLIAMSFLFVLLIKRAFLFTFISGPELCTITFLCRFYVMYCKVV